MKKIGFLSHLDLNLYLFRLPIMRALKSRGWEVYAIAPRGDYLDRFTDEGIRTISYRIERASLDPLRELRALRNIYRAIRPLQLDLLHTFTAKPNIYGTIAGMLAGVPHIVNLVEGLGSFYVEESPKARLVRRIIEILYKQAFKRSDACIFVNSDDPRYMMERGIIEPAKVRIIKSVGIDTKRFAPENIKKIEFATSKPVVMMVGRAIWHKGVREFYEAAKMLQHKAHFVYVGGTDSGNPSAASEEFLRSGVVEYLGHRDDIADLIGSCDIFVLPSYREGLPRTLLEAAALAKPLVATDTVGCRDVVQNGYNGFLVPPRDAKALAEAIEQLVDLPNLRKQMGEHARRYVTENFALEKVVAQYLALYNEVLGV